MSMKVKEHRAVEIILNIIIVVFAVTGTFLMLTEGSDEGVLEASGIENFKFYTVLSNVFCGITALIYLILRLFKKNADKMASIKLGAVCSVAITFSIVAFFFGPLYGYVQFYQRGNLFFHLLLPVTAMAEFFIVRRKKIPFKHTVIAAVPTLIYGTCYMLNILINGIGGPWPYTNDFYAFLSWGWPVGILIFASITFAAFGFACLFRAVSNKRSGS